jgi:hypothetical protein
MARWRAPAGTLIGTELYDYYRRRRAATDPPPADSDLVAADAGT